MRQTLFLIPILLLFVACRTPRQVNPRLDVEMPKKIVWAWERPEDLRFLDPKEFGVAFLAQTIFLDKNGVNSRPRRQPLEVPDGIYLIAVTRIETNKVTAERATFDDEMAARTADLIRSTLDRPNVRSLQVDFDAVVSERSFYRTLMNKLRQQTPEAVPLTMTSLASWCTGDAWFNDFPVDEAVPMAFQMGADEEKIKNYLRKGNDWREPLCRDSYGISVDDPLKVELKPDRRTYYFSDKAWRPNSVQAARP